MCENNTILERIKRITEMEMYFDTLRESHDETPAMQEILQKLIAYYEGPDWRSDFESDERGELPKELKRGVLSEDGIYNLLTETNK